MARKNYESQVLSSTTRFVNEKKEKENIVEPIVEEKIESVIVTPTEVKEPIIEQKTEIKEDPSPAQNVPPLGPGIDIDALLDAKLKEYLKNNKGKVGRPRDYDEETTVISIRLEKRIYEFAKNQARVENTSMTQYIKELIRKEMDKG